MLIITFLLVYCIMLNDKLTILHPYFTHKQYKLCCMFFTTHLYTKLYNMHFNVRGVLTIVLLCHLFRGGLLSGPSSNLDQLLDDFLCGHSAVDGQEGIFQSLKTTCKKSLSVNIKLHSVKLGSILLRFGPNSHNTLPFTFCNLPSL